MNHPNKDDLRPRLAQLLNRVQGKDLVNVRREPEHKPNQSQEQLRNFLEKSRASGQMDRAKLLQLSESLIDKRCKLPQPPQRLSLAQNRGLKISSPSTAQGLGSATLKAQGTSKPPVEPRTVKQNKPPVERPTLRDSIYFQNEIDYENYLKRELEKQGLFRDLFEKMKVLYVTRRDLQALMLLFEHLQELHLDECQINLEKAEVFRLLDDMEKAYLYLDKAVRADPSSIIALRSIALYHKLKDEHELALHWLLEWKKISLKDPEVHYQLSVVYHRMDQHSLALVSVRKTLDLDPKHMLARSLMEKLL